MSDTANFQPFAAKMHNAGLRPELIDLFREYYQQLASGHTGKLSEAEIRPLDKANDLLHQDDLTAEAGINGRHTLDQTVMIKLNGGLGTSMGMPYAKSLLEVKQGNNFLDVIVMQCNGCDGQLQYSLPLALMDSFATHQETIDYLQQQGIRLGQDVFTFVQHKFPKIRQDTLEPATYPEDPELEWNPPGHGDIYAALETSGLLNQLLSDGYRYAFVSNSDNLGAVVDSRLLGAFADSGAPFMIEVCRRTGADTKGGHLARHKDGRLILREIAQCPDEELDAFQDVERFKYFNTNNIWIDLQQLRDFIDAHGFPQLPIIVNPKTVNPRDENSTSVFQIETAMGAAVAAFPGALAVQVNRDRFIPVKKTNDLLAVWSDCYIFTPDCRIVPNPERRLGTIIITLDSTYFKKIEQLTERFQHGAPSLVECSSLTIHGDFAFGPNVVCRDYVVLENRGAKQVVIPEGTVLEGKQVWEA